jgi:RecA-family ATPase
MSIHHELDGGPDGLALWDAWSAKGSKYKEGECEYQWGSFGRYNGEPLTAAYLLKITKEKLEKTLDEVSEELPPDEGFKGLDWSPSRFLAIPPPIEMVIHGMLPKGIVSLLYSEGGAGKSTWVLNMAVRIAMERDEITVLGKAVEPGAVVILTAEDPDVVLNRRYISTLEVLAEEVDSDMSTVRQEVEKNLKIWSTFGNPVSLFGIDPKNNTLKTTKQFTYVIERLQTLHNLQLVIIDTKTRFSPGEGEGNVIAAREITFYEMICRKTGATVMLLHHTNKASRDGSQDGKQAYRDATANFDNTRASWYMRPATLLEKNTEGFKDDDDILVMENAKNNYIKKHNTLLLKREGYRYEFCEQGPKVPKEQQKERARQTLVDGLIAFMQADRADKYTQAELVEWGRINLNAGRSAMVKVLGEGADDGFFDIEDLGPRRAKFIKLTEYGKKHNLIIE